MGFKGQAVALVKEIGYYSQDSGLGLGFEGWSFRVTLGSSQSGSVLVWFKLCLVWFEVQDWVGARFKIRVLGCTYG